MAIARHQFTVTDDRGNVVPNAFVRVRAERPGMPLVQLFADRFGAVNLSNPFQADSEGYAGFHVSGGAYHIEAFKGAFSRIWRYVGIGLAQESDLTAFTAQGEWDAGFSYESGSLVTFGDFVYVSIVDNNLGNQPPTTGSPPEGSSNEFWQFIPALQGAPGVGDLYDFSAYVQNRPHNAEYVARHIFTSEVTFEAGLERSQASADVAATADAVFSISRNGLEVATVTFGAGQTSGVFDMENQTTFFPGDILRILGPDPRDLTLAEVTFTLLGER